MEINIESPEIKAQIKALLKSFENQPTYIKRFNNFYIEIHNAIRTVANRYLDKEPNKRDIDFNDYYNTYKRSILKTIIAKYPTVYEKHFSKDTYFMFVSGTEPINKKKENKKIIEIILKYELLEMIKDKTFIAKDDKQPKVLRLYKNLNFNYSLFGYLTAIKKYVQEKEEAPNPVNLIDIAKKYDESNREVIRFPMNWFIKELDN